MVEEKDIIQCGECVVIVEKDEKGRPCLTPFCPSDEKGQPVLSEQVKVLKEVLQSDEIVLRPPKIKEE